MSVAIPLSLCLSQLKDYIKNDLLPMIYAAGDQTQLMEESQESSIRREEMVRMYHACKDALNIISDVGTKTGQCLCLVYLLVLMVSSLSEHPTPSSCCWQ